MAKLSPYYPGRQPAKEYNGWVLMKAYDLKSEATAYVNQAKKVNKQWELKGTKFYDAFKILKL